MPIVKTSQLIKEAYYLAKILDPAEEIEGFYLTEGLDVLNQGLAQWVSLGVNIPNVTNVPVSLTTNNFLYSVSPQIVEIKQANIVDSANVKYPLLIADEFQQNTFNYDIVKARPSYVYMRQNGELIDEETDAASTNLYFYPTPNANFTVNLTVKELILEFGLEDELSTIPSYYIKPLKFYLAQDLSIIYSTVLPPRFDKEYERLMREMKAANRQDMSVLNVNTMRGYRQFRPWGVYAG
jgi:hypothetical protein